jgi:hypothetical protein
VTGYDLLLELAQRESELVSAGDIDGLAELNRERNAVVATLPATPPRTALPALEEALRIVDDTAARLEAAMAGIASERARLGQGRRAASAYLRA